MNVKPIKDESDYDAALAENSSMPHDPVRVAEVRGALVRDEDIPLVEGQSRSMSTTPPSPVRTGSFLATLLSRPCSRGIIRQSSDGCTSVILRA